MKKLLFLLMSFVLISSFLVSGCSDDKVLRIGVGARDGNSAFSVKALNEKLKASGSSFILKPVWTSGSDASVRLLNYGVVDLALAHGPAIKNAFNFNMEITSSDRITRFSSQSFDVLNDGDDIEEYYSAVGGVYDETLQIVVKENSAISLFSDLLNKRVAVGGEDDYVGKIAAALLKADEKDGIGPSIKTTDAKGALDMLREDEADVAIIFDKVPSEAVTAFAKENQIRMLRIPEGIMKLMTRSDKSYGKTVISPADYPFLVDTRNTLKVKTLLLAHDGLADETIMELLGGIFAGGDKTAADETGEARRNEMLEAAVPQLDPKFHPGAYEFFLKHGIEVKLNEKHKPWFNFNLVAGQD